MTITINYVAEVVLCHTAYYVKKLWIWWKLWLFLFSLLWGRILINFGSMDVEMNTPVSQDTFSVQNDNKFNVMMLLQCIIASIGIIANLTVVIVFLNHKELRRKIPNRFIINQVGIFCKNLLLKTKALCSKTLRSVYSLVLLKTTVFWLILSINSPHCCFISQESFEFIFINLCASNLKITVNAQLEVFSFRLPVYLVVY